VEIDFPSEAKRATYGFLQAARSVDSLLNQIKIALQNGLLPQRDALLGILEFDDTIEQAVCRYAYDQVLALEQWDEVASNFSANTLQLTLLEEALVKLHDAVKWSSDVSGFNWWVQTRQKELAVQSLIVVPAPGTSKDFEIDPVPALGSSFRRVQAFVSISDEKLAQLDSVRMLTVPRSDGASAKWHPISLGHELAHLRFTAEWVCSWLAGVQSDDETVRTARGIAEDLTAAGLKSATTEKWFVTLNKWLIETACDATMTHYYGLQGVTSLDTYLSVHSKLEDGEEHPSPRLRLAVLGARVQADLENFMLDYSHGLHSRYRRNAFCSLALELREKVWSDLGGTAIDRDARDRLTASAVKSMDSGTPPVSKEWDTELMVAKPATIESALVASLWTKILTFTRSDFQDGISDTQQRYESNIEQSVDFLQFLHRFSRRRLHHRLEVPPNQSEPTNVLFVSTNGIALQGSAPRGVANYDVRLGRHFVVFRRNQIATLNALDTDSHTRQIQDAVEIGWGDKFVLHPGGMVLAVTLESIIMSEDCTAQVLSRSSLGRMGLLSATAVQVQPGFAGTLTLELSNLASVPLVLSPGQRIAQIVPAATLGEVAPYTGKYQGQDWKPRFSAVVQDWEMQILKDLREDLE
jgi:deoxycytidine triphosphate deaminase